MRLLDSDKTRFAVAAVFSTTDDNELTICNCCNLTEDLPFCRLSNIRRRRSVIVGEGGNERFKYDRSDTLDRRLASLCY